MKGKTLLWGGFLFGFLWFFFRSFGVYTLQRQEEVQLFIPEASVLWDKLCLPGGFCTMVGQALVQTYTSQMATLFIQSFILCCVGWLSWLLLQKISDRPYHYLLALFPVWFLARVHISAFYVVEGTLAILFLLLLLYGYLSIRPRKWRMVYGVASVVLLYWGCGQIVALYGVLLGLLSWQNRQTRGYDAIGICLLGVLLTFLAIRGANGVPLTDGIYSERYQESQLQPDSYLYFVWIRFTVLFGFLSLAAFLLSQLSWEKRGMKVGVWFLSTLSFGLFLLYNQPNPEAVRNNEMDKLSYLSRQQDWEEIIRIFKQQKPSNYIQLNYLTLALAQKGVLGDQLFQWDPKGPQSLLVSWDRTYYTSVLLSDIHAFIGDVSLSESYAMEGLTLAKRGGSPRMLQRLVTLSSVRQEWELARKYLHILQSLPYYRSWAVDYRKQLEKPDALLQSPAFSTLLLPKSQPDNLHSLLNVDSLWTAHLQAEQPNRMAFAYLGCSYLLAKESDKFKSFLLQYAGLPEWQPLPVHFQEAALLIALSEPEILQTVSVRPDIIERFKQFQQDIQRATKDRNGLLQLRQKYGDTYWFYYYCKNI